jgi:hypothetical protein
MCRCRRPAKLSCALVVLFGAGVLLAGLVVTAGKAQQQTTTETTVETTTTTAPATTETVERTTTRTIVPRTTTAAEGSSNSAPTWAWVVIGVLAVAALGLGIALLTRRGGRMSLEERRRRLDGAITGWVGQGWAIDSQSADSAVLRRGGELMLVSIDENGAISTRPLPPQQPAPRS